MASPLPRPRQIQVAGWLIIVGCLLTVVGAFDQVRALGSLQLAEEIERQLERPVFNGVTMTIDEVEGWLRVFSIISALCATTMTVLAWQVLQERSTVARLWLTVLAVPMFFTGMITDGLITTMVVVSVGLLWTLPARQWFAGTWKPEPIARPLDRSADRPRAEADRRPNAFTPPSTPPNAAPHDGSAPPPMAAWPPVGPGATGVPTMTAPPHAAAPLAGMPGAPAPQTAPMPAGPRPRAVLVAAVLTWVFSALCAIAFVTVMTVAAVNPDQIMSEMRQINPELMEQEGITVGVVQAMFAFLAAVVVVWTVSACVLAILVMRRIAWARVTLVVCAGSAALILLLAALASPIVVLPFAASVATVGLLLRRDVAAWVARR